MEGFARGNTLAYFAITCITAKKSFIKLGPGLRASDALQRSNILPCLHPEMTTGQSRYPVMTLEWIRAWGLGSHTWQSW